MSDENETFEARLIRENHEWLDGIAENDIESAVDIAKLNTDVAGKWGQVWLEKRDLTDPLVVKCAAAFQKFEKGRLEHNRAHGLPPDSVNSWLATDSGRRLYADVCRADAERNQ